MIRTLILVVAISQAACAWGQSTPLAREIAFAEHLSEMGEFREALYVLRGAEERIGQISAPEKDSLHYWKGWLYQLEGVYDSAAIYLGQVSSASAFYPKARHYTAFDYMSTNRHAQVDSVLPESAATIDSMLAEFNTFQRAGALLLGRRMADFDTVAQTFTYGHAPFADEQHSLMEIRSRIAAQKRKSPALAGIYSALAPGTGKIYAGSSKEGLAQMIHVLTIAGIATESYLRGGAGSVRFIAFGAAFSVFYIGNIWGSVLSVNKKKKSLKREIDHNILLDVHAPLHRVFN